MFTKVYILFTHLIFVHSKYILLLVMISLAGLPGCNSVTSQQSKINVVATTTIVGDIVSNIGGENIDLTVIIGKGVDPHDYQATSADSVVLDNADIIFYSGGGVEEGLETTLSELTKNGKAFSLFDAIPDEYLITNPLATLEDEHQVDPHFWHDPSLTNYTLNMIANALGKLDTTIVDQLTENVNKYQIELSNTDEFIQQEVLKLNSSPKVLVTQHNAFQYWTSHYGFVGKSLVGISTNDAAGIAEIDKMAEFLKNNNVSVIFLESTVPNEQAQAVIDAANAIGWTVKNGGVLFTGSLGDGEASTYLGMLKSNAQIIIDGLLSPPVQEAVPFPSLSIIFLALIGFVILRRKSRWIL